jgi:thiol:disulfide interchange protein
MIVSLMFAVALALAPAQGRTEAKQNPKPEPIFDEQADGAEQIAGALESARQENRRVLIEWGANWCSWCRLLHGLCKSDEKIRHELLYEYDVVRVDVGRFDKHLELMRKYGVDLKKTGIPFLTILDADGKVLANQETGSLELKEEGQKGHDPAKVLELLSEHQAPYLAAEDLYSAALASAKEQDKRLFLHLGAPW